MRPPLGPRAARPHSLEPRLSAPMRASGPHSRVDELLAPADSGTMSNGRPQGSASIRGAAPRIRVAYAVGCCLGAVPTGSAACWGSSDSRPVDRRRRGPCRLHRLRLLLVCSCRTPLCSWMNPESECLTSPGRVRRSNEADERRLNRMARRLSENTFSRPCHFLEDVGCPGIRRSASRRAMRRRGWGDGCRGG